MIIYLDKQYGLNSSEINFIPYCQEEIRIGNYIESGDFILRCINKDYFRLITNNPNDFILGSDLLNNEWKIKKYE